MHKLPSSFLIIIFNSLLVKIDCCYYCSFYPLFGLMVLPHNLMMFLLASKQLMPSCFHTGNPNPFLYSNFLTLYYIFKLPGLLRTLINFCPSSAKCAPCVSNYSTYLLSNPVCVFDFLDCTINCSYCRAFDSNWIN